MKPEEIGQAGVNPEFHPAVYATVPPEERHKMTDQERKLVAACGEFCHVTTAEGSGDIDVAGLDPALDDSIVIRGPKRDKAIYLCPADNLNKAADFIGSRASDQPKLYVYRIGAAELADKECGADIGWLVNLVGEADWTVAVSLELGTIACYEAIARAELSGPQEIDNPRYIASSGDDEQELV